MREGNFSPEDKGGAAERHEGISEREVRELLETRHTISNAGNKGIIFKFPKGDIPPSLQAIFQGADEDEEKSSEEETESFSIKALKIYSVGDAEREYKALEKAHRAMATAGKEKPTARVPRANGFYEVTVSEKFRDFLNEHGAVLTDRKVGIIIMDYIEGEDLATLLYKKALHQQKSANPHTPDYVDTLSFNELHREVAAALHFAKPGGKSRDEGERRFEEEMVKTSNAKKLIQSLRKGGFVLPPAILEQIQNAVEQLHKSGVFHNDLHERNVIIKNADLANPQSYIIDFGSASVGEIASEERGVKISPDKAIIDRLAPLTKTLGEERDEKLHEKHEEWENVLRGLEKQPSSMEQYRHLKESIQSDAGDEFLEKQFSVHSGSDRDVQKFLAILLKIYREDEAHRDGIRQFLDRQGRRENIRAFVANKIKEWEREIGNQSSL